jgi:Zn finger protein HypA/HybF involved in hydrogenase expression
MTRTVDDINLQLAPRGYKMVGAFTTVGTKTTFGCPNGHQWESKPNNVLSGHGCPKCKLLSREEVNRRIEDRNITMIGDYVTTKVKSTFECRVCKHQWSAKVNNVLNGHGCPICRRLNQRLTVDVLNDKLRVRDIVLHGEYLLSAKKTTFNCKVCEHIWEATPNNVLGGSGCPSCADYGFNDATSAVIYLSEYDDFVKVGITNNFDRRMNELEKNNLVTPINIIRYDVDSGKAARAIEQVVKNKFIGKYKSPDVYPDGYTETFLKENMTDILEIIEGNLNVLR